MITLTLLGAGTTLAVAANRISMIEPCPNPNNGSIVHLGSHRIIVTEQFKKVIELTEAGSSSELELLNKFLDFIHEEKHSSNLRLGWEEEYSDDGPFWRRGDTHLVEFKGTDGVYRRVALDFLWRQE